MYVHIYIYCPGGIVVSIIEDLCYACVQVCSLWVFAIEIAPKGPVACVLWLVAGVTSQV